MAPAPLLLLLPGGIIPGIIIGGPDATLLGVAPTDLAFVLKLDGARFGGAIIAASGSLGAEAAAVGEGAAGVCGVDGKVGGGPIGFAFSSGSSPGKTQLLKV